MKNTFGQHVSVTVFGESHGIAIGAVLDGLCPGTPIDEENIIRMLRLRQPGGAISTARNEKDQFEILSGVVNGIATGTPLTIIIRNQDTKSGDYAQMQALMRPGHADYPAQCKYHGYQDTRGGGHFSGRITAGLVAAGAVALTALKNKGIQVATHIYACGGVYDRHFEDIPSDIQSLSHLDFAVLDSEKSKQMQDEITKAKMDGDSVGGILETAVIGFPEGVGEPWFDSLESVLAHAIFSVPAVKGVEFGDGFSLSGMRASMSNDPFRMDNGSVVTPTNHCGGILGGISNGMPLMIRTAIKPTPSIFKDQNTVNFKNGTDTVLSIKGRHDPAIVHRAAVVLDSVTALVLCDQLALRFGTDFLGG